MADDDYLHIRVRQMVARLHDATAVPFCCVQADGVSLPAESLLKKFSSHGPRRYPLCSKSLSHTARAAGLDEVRMPTHRSAGCRDAQPRTPAVKAIL